MDWIERDDGWFTFYECPACGERVFEKAKACPACGETLWRDGLKKDTMTEKRKGMKK